MAERQITIRRVEVLISVAAVEVLIVLRAGERQRVILVLIVVSMKQRELLLAVRRIVPGIPVQGDPRRWFGKRWLGKRWQEQVHKHAPRAVPISDADGVLKPRERRLTGQVLLRIAGIAIRNPLEDRVVTERVVIVLIFIVREHPSSASIP